MDAVRGPCRHARHDRDARCTRQNGVAHRLHHILPQRGCIAAGRIAQSRDRGARIIDDLRQLRLHILNRHAGENPAIDADLGALGQRIERMAGLRHGRDAGRAHLPDKFRAARQYVCRRRIACFGKAPHRLAHLATDPVGGQSQRRLGQFVAHQRKPEGRNPVDRFRQAIDGVARRWRTAMAARIGKADLEIGIGLLARLQLIQDGLALFAQQSAAAIAVEQHFGVLILRRQRARRRHVGFLVARQQQCHGSTRLPSFLLQLRQRRDHHRDIIFIVLRPAAEDIAIVLDRDEWVARPVLGISLHHIHMPDHQQGLERRIPPLDCRGESRRLAHRRDNHISVGKARLFQYVGIIGRQLGHLPRPLDRAKRDRPHQYVLGDPRIRRRLRHLRRHRQRQSQTRLAQTHISAPRNDQACLAQPSGPANHPASPP